MLQINTEFLKQTNIISEISKSDTNIMDKNTINNRFIDAISYLLSHSIAKSKGEIAEVLNISNSKFSEILNNRMNVGTDIAATLCFKYNINANWLLTGRDEMINNNKVNLMPAVKSQELNFTAIPVVDIDVAAGVCGYDNPNFLEIIDTISLPNNMIRKNGTYFCVRVKGESMSPTLLDSSYIILRLLDRSEWRDLKDNYVYAISDREGRSYLKRIKSRLKEHGFIVCTSDNVDKANYPNFNIMEDEINNILYAEWYLSAKMPNLNATYYDKVNHLEDDVDFMKGQISQILRNINQKK